MERETVELVLPKSGVKVVLYSYLNTGEMRQMQKVALSSMKVNIRDNQVETPEVSGTLAFDMQESAIGFLVKEVYTKEGTKVENPKEYIDSLSYEDGNVVYEKVQELTSGSSLSKEVKKN